MRSIVKDTYDRYYTKPEYAEYFWKVIQNKLNINDYSKIFEPAAGSGSFFNLFDKDKRVGIDINPQCKGVQKQDFKKYWPDWIDQTISVGNNPFGEQSKDAIYFFNKCGKFSQALCFINPKSFRKISVIEQLDKNFHLLWDEDVPPGSFISHNNKKLTVNCCSQIWVKKYIKRKDFNIKDYDYKSYFTFCDPDKADISLQRIGSKAGMILTKNFKHLDNQHYFIKFTNRKFKKTFTEINFNKVRDNTGGGRSIGRREVVQLFYNKIKG